MTSDPLAQVRRCCLALPLVSERLSHGTPSFFIKEKRAFVTYWDNHHDDGRLALWCAAPEGAQTALIDEDPELFFRPPYVGSRGWVGVRLDREADWEEIALLIDQAYHVVATQTRPTQTRPTRATANPNR